MGRETEIKLRINDVAALRKKLSRLGAKPAGKAKGRVWEQNTIFDTPQGGLAKHGQLLRVRVETPDGERAAAKVSPRVLLTFKRPVPERQTVPAGADRKHKVREEIEVEASDAANLMRIFEGLGLAGWFRYEKYRTTYRLGAAKKWANGLLIVLDETPIGAFIELEGPGEAIDRAAQELGFSKRDYILKNYLVLYVEECRRRGEEPKHMLFSPTQRQTK
jgi:adenylate cyclase class 2